MMIRRIAQRLTALAACTAAVMAAPVDAAVVGVLHRNDNPRTSGSGGILETLRASTDHEVRELAGLEADELAGVDVVIISRAYLNKQADSLRAYVAGGGSAIMLHHAAGSGRPLPGYIARPTFPEVAGAAFEGSSYLPTHTRVVPFATEHPIAEALPADGFDHTYWDHITLKPAEGATVVLRDEPVQDPFWSNRLVGTQHRWQPYYDRFPVVVAGEVGEGRVVLCGLILGLDRTHRNAAFDGPERRLLLNMIEWSIAEGDDRAAAPAAEAPRPMEGAPGVAIPLDARGVALASEPVSPAALAEPVALRLALPESAPLGQWIVVRAAAEGLPAGACSVAVVEDGTAGPAWPAQVERTADGGAALHFVGRFESRQPQLLVRAADADAPGVEVTVSDDGRVGEIRGPHFRLVVAAENGRATLQGAEVFDWDWHHTWDGLERTGLSAPVLRLSQSLWPFREPFPKVDHERGMALPTAGTAATAVSFPVMASLRVGDGRIDVYHTGQVRLHGFATEGRLATMAFDGYRTDAGWTEETASYDVPAVDGRWTWAVRKDRYALGGDLEIVDRVGETGLAPGLERQVRLTGERLVLLADDRDLDAHRAPLEAIQARATRLDGAALAGAADRSAEPATLHRRVVKVRQLVQRRGEDAAWPALPRPVELFVDERPGAAEGVTTWRLDAPAGWSIGASLDSAFADVVTDDALRAAGDALRSDEEEPELWRRTFVRYDGDTFPAIDEATLVGVDENDRVVLRVPLRLEAWVGVPTGIFTYSAQWTEQAERTPAAMWPRLFRDIGMSRLDYVIHSTYDDSFGVDRGETPDLIGDRLHRHGVHWLASLQYQGADHYTEKTGEVRAEGLRDSYRAAIERFADLPHVLGWYLSDEIPRGEPGDPKHALTYAAANVFYETFKAIAPDTLAVNLFSPSHTSYRSASELKTDVVSWDPYGVGTRQVIEAVDNAKQMIGDPQGKPTWLTLRVCGPTFYDTLDLWLDVRRRSLSAWREGVDGINYFMYAHWLSDLESRSFYAVLPGPEGPIATPRWQAVYELAEDLDLLTTAEHLVQQRPSGDRAAVRERLDAAAALGAEGRTYQMREQLLRLIDELSPKTMAATGAADARETTR